ncbi:MAG TPA: hypothetical protein VGH89_16790 [Pseudonocardia sp.]|jgi:heparin binding hemagglutinin HbhA
MAIKLPTSSDVRRARARADELISNQFDLVRTPVLAWIGASDLAVHTLRELPTKFNRAELRTRADKAYSEWTARGEDAVRRLREQPRVARALRGVEDADKRVSTRVEKIVDELHDAGEDFLGSVSSETRSVGEKTARRTQRASRQAAATVTNISDDVAESVVKAGDEVAHESRSVARKAANRTAP